MKGSLPIAVNDRGYVAEADLRWLDIPDWISWILARSTEFDPFTGQTLVGLANRYALLEQSLLNARDERVAGNFFAGAWAIVRELLTLLRSDKRIDAPDMESRCSTLTDLLDFLRCFPNELVRTYPGFIQSEESLYQFCVREGENISDTDAFNSARASALRLLDHLRVPFAESDSAVLLSDPSLASEIAVPLIRSHPDKGSEIIARVYDGLVSAGMGQLFLGFVKALETKELLERNGLQATLLNAARYLNSNQRWAFWNDPGVLHACGESPALRTMIERGTIRFTLLNYIEGWQPLGEELLSRIMELVREVCGSEIIPIPDREERTWDSQAKLARKGRSIALDPIFMTPTRGDGIFVVPYGILWELALVFAKTANLDRTRTETLSRCKDLRVLRMIKMAIGTIEQTAADEELMELEEEWNTQFYRVKQFLRVDELFQWLTNPEEEMTADGDIVPRVAIVDIGFAHDLQKHERSLPRISRGERGARMPIEVRRVPYRHPVLVGVPIPHRDWIWGQLVAEAVAEVFYRRHALADSTSSLAKLLSRVGIEPFEPSALAEKQPWGESVPDFLFPTSHLDDSEKKKLAMKPSQGSLH